MRFIDRLHKIAKGMEITNPYTIEDRVDEVWMFVNQHKDKPIRFVFDNIDDLNKKEDYEIELELAEFLIWAKEKELETLDS